MQTTILLTVQFTFALVEGSVFQTTRTALDDITHIYRSEQRVQDGFNFDGKESCYGDVLNTEGRNSQTNKFLDMVNFMEYIQQTETSEGYKDAENYYKVAKAAMEGGNTFVAQENLARALGVIQMNGRRKRRDSSGWDATQLFDQFRNALGEEKFKEVLHLDKKITIAFVIDSSSSMQDDMDKVRLYISKLVEEQQRAGVEAEFIVTTFADGPANIRTFSTADTLTKYLGSLNPNIGGDCEERTCYGILSTLYRSNFMRVRNSVMYVFTDATSKDCLRTAPAIIRSLSFLRAPAFFILFDSCKPTIDENYVKIARSSGGFCLLVKNNGVYNITDTVNGAFNRDSLIFGEDSDNAASVVGQRLSQHSRKRRSPDEGRSLQKSFLVDTSIESFKVIASIRPVSLLSEVQLIKPAEDGLCGTLESSESNVKVVKSMADNSVVFDVTTLTCPCTGQWRVSYPEDSDSFSYSVKSSGEYLVSFEAYFVDRTGGSSIATYSPCVGMQENLVVKLNQGEKVKTDTLIAKIVGLAGNVVLWEGELAEDKLADNAFLVSVTIPRDMGIEGFRVELEGQIIDGSKFHRVSSTVFHPTTSCLRITGVGNYHALSPYKKTHVKVRITNHDSFEELYLLSCTNSANYDVTIGFPMIKGPQGQQKRARSNPERRLQY